MTLSNAHDSQDLNFDDPRLYFNEQELNSLEHVLTSVPYGSKIYSDYCVNRYFNSLKKFSHSDFLGLPYYSSFPFKSNYSVSEKGYEIFRNEEYFNHGLLVESDLGGELETLLSNTQMEKNLIYMDKIFDSEDISIYLV
jgi:hypothetical protein